MFIFAMNRQEKDLRTPAIYCNRSRPSCLDETSGSGRCDELSQINHWPVKNSVMSGAVSARPGNVFTPEAARMRRNVLWC